MKNTTKLIFIFLLFTRSFSFATENKKFRYSLPQEPNSLDHTLLKSPGSSYFFTLLQRNLFKLDTHLKPIPDLAEKCVLKKKLTYSCTLKKGLKWNDGSPILSSHFLNTYQHMLSPTTPAPRKDFLYFIKNAKEIVENKKKMTDLGVRTPTPQTLEFDLQEEDPELNYILAMDIIAPLPNLNLLFTSPTQLKTSGPYMIAEWEKNKKISLKPNPYYDNKIATRPDIEIWIVSDDNAVLNLYLKGDLDLVQRVPTLFIPQYKGRPDFRAVPVYRFDYLGFGPKLKDQLELRKALVHSVDFSGLQKIYNSPGRPGCTSLSEELMGPTICYDHQAKAYKVPTPSLNLWLSKSAGEDSKRGMEWLQDQWKKNLQISMSIHIKENKTFTDELTKNPPDVFRRGVGLEIPTCRNALLVFTSNHYENFVRYSHPQFDQLVLKDLKKNPNDLNLCRKAIQILMDNYAIIPLGEFYFSMLVRPEWKNVRINKLNQLFVDDL